MDIAPLPAWKRSRRNATSRGRAFGEMLPRITFVPDEVVQHRGFHGERGGRQIVHLKRAEQQREGAHLHYDAQAADRVELDPADRERRHGRRSAS